MDRDMHFVSLLELLSDIKLLRIMYKTIAPDD